MAMSDWTHVLQDILEMQNCISSLSLRFLAHEHGLGGQTKLDDAKIDEVVDVVSDFQNALVL